MRPPATPAADVYAALLQEMQRTVVWLKKRQVTVLREFGISSPQFALLHLLHQQAPRPATVRGLMAGMAEPFSNVSRLVDNLVRRELVVRVICSADRRAVDIVLTPDATDLLTHPALQNFGAELGGLAKLTPRQAADLAESLRRLLAE